METPRAVVIPFGVPNDGRGLGLGLAALVHAFVHVEGEGVAIAQLHSRRDESSAEVPAAPVEAFVPPQAWRDIAGRGDGPRGVGVVLTGSFEPPVDGTGTIRLLAFDAHDGSTRATVDASLDGDRAGAALVEALEQLWSRVGGEVGSLRVLRELGWEPLESVILAERCALHDPARGGPYDRLAAMLHFGRAIGDAPEARYPIERLASIALETASGAALDTRLAGAAVRALERAAIDASTNGELVEALAALLLRLGRPQEAERRMNAAIAVAPSRPRAYSFLAQALRAQGKLDGALATLQAGVHATGPDPSLSIERGMVLAAFGDLAGAAAAWREALDRDPMNPAAFGRLAGLALRARDGAVAQALVDSALALANAPVDVLRNALPLALGTEPEGLSRAVRLLKLGERVLEKAPNDAGALVLVARAQLALGDKAAALARIDQVERLSTTSAAAAEAQAIRLAIDDPRAELEVQSVLRASRTVAVESLGDVTARARRLATAHSSWLAWLAAAIAEKRRGRWAAARGALEMALGSAPGAAPLHLELAEVLLELDDPESAVARAQSAMAVDGPTTDALCLLARALGATGRTSEAIEAAKAGLALQPEDARLQQLIRELQSPRQRRAWLRNLGRRVRGWLAV